MALTDYARLVVKISWDGSGAFTGTYDDVSSYVRPPFRTNRGRAQVNDRVGPSTGTLVLRNDTGRFSPYNAASPLFGSLLPMRPIKVTSTYNGTTYPVFTGYCTADSQNPSGPGQAVVTYKLVDAYERLRQGRTRTPLAINQTVNQLMTTILDDIGWSATLRALDTGTVNIAFFTNHNRLPLNALQLAENQEPGSLLFMGRDGSVTWQNRNYRSSQSTYATLANTLYESLDPQIRPDDNYSSVRVVWPRFAEGAAVEPVFTMSRRVAIPPGVSTVSGEVNVSGVIAARSYAAPSSGAGDFNVNSQSDGSGTDKTAQVSMTVAAGISSNGFDLTVTNVDSATGWLLVTGLRAVALKAGGETNAYEATVASPIVVGQQLSRTFEFMQDASIAQGFADFTASTMNVLRPRPTISIVPNTDAAMAMILGAELSKRVRLTDNASAWQTGIDNDFFIESIQFEFESPTMIRATWMMFDTERAGGNYFRISGALGGGADYSPIATAGATSGYARIAY